MIQIKKSGGLYQGIVRRAVYLGDVIEYVVEVNGIPILGIETDPHVTKLFPEGEDVTLGLAKGCIQMLSAAKTS